MKYITEKVPIIISIEGVVAIDSQVVGLVELKTLRKPSNREALVENEAGLHTLSTEANCIVRIKKKKEIRFELLKSAKHVLLS